jgi:hypothetical protein
VGYNFLDHPPRVPRNIFREPEPEPAAPADEMPAAAAPVAKVDSATVGAVLFRTLKQFPEAYRAVVQALREISPDLAPA